MNTLLNTIPNRAAEIFYGQPTSSGRILVVDDDVDLRHLIVELLMASGYEVDDAENGARAWKVLHLNQYDLLLTDNEMPEMTGLQLVEKLRLAGFKLPVIFASGRLSPDLVTKNTHLGLAATLPKPFTPEELTSTVKGLLPVLPALTPGFNSNPWQWPPHLAVHHDGHHPA